MKKVHLRTSEKRTWGASRTSFDTLCGANARSAAKATEDVTKVTCQYCQARIKRATNDGYDRMAGGGV